MTREYPAIAPGAEAVLRRVVVLIAAAHPAILRAGAGGAEVPLGDEVHGGLLRTSLDVPPQSIRRPVVSTFPILEPLHPLPP